MYIPYICNNRLGPSLHGAFHVSLNKPQPIWSHVAIFVLIRLLEEGPQPGDLLQKKLQILCIFFSQAMIFRLLRFAGESDWVLRTIDPQKSKKISEF